MSIEQLVFDRFIHRPDTYRIQTYTEDKGGSYYPATVGSCNHNPVHTKKTDCPNVSLDPVSLDTIRRHLQGEITIGIFQLSDDNTVKWACIDVDIVKGADGEGLQDLVQQQTKVLAAAAYNIIGPRFIIEDSGSRGYHLWIFFEPFAQARYALAIAEYIVTNTAHIDHRISFEVFPKQTAIRNFGNMVKLPLGIHRKSNRRCLFVDNTFTPHKNQRGKLLATPTLTEEQALAIIRKHKLGLVNTIRLEPSASNRTTTALPCFSRLMVEGAPEGMRDVGMYRLAVYLRNREFPIDVAEVVMEAVNEKNHPPLSDDVLQRKLESGYTEDSSVFPCRVREFDALCTSSCYFYKGKLDDRWTKYGRDPKDAIGVLSRD